MELQTEDQYHDALREFEKLMGGVLPSEADRFLELAAALDAYEKEHFPMGWPTPGEAIRFRMEQMGMSEDDLVPFIGTRAKVDAVLAGQHRVTLTMQRALAKKLGIPKTLLQEHK